MSNVSRQHRAVESLLKGGDQLVLGSGADSVALRCRLLTDAVDKGVESGAER